MKCFKLLAFFFIFLGVVLFYSCGEDACERVTCLNNGICVDGICNCNIVGTWNVTNIQPSNCTVLTYQFGTGMSSSIFSVTIDDGSRIFTGSGLLDTNCEGMTYSAQAGSTIVSGAIRFDGSTFADQSGFGCLISAAKK
jgi:hypothetical protein